MARIFPNSARFEKKLVFLTRVFKWRVKLAALAYPWGGSSARRGSGNGVPWGGAFRAFGRSPRLAVFNSSWAPVPHEVLTTIGV